MQNVVKNEIVLVYPYFEALCPAPPVQMHVYICVSVNFIFAIYISLSLCFLTDVITQEVLEQVRGKWITPSPPLMITQKLYSSTDNVIAARPGLHIHIFRHHIYGGGHACLWACLGEKLGLVKHILWGKTCLYISGWNIQMVGLKMLLWEFWWRIRRWRG